MKQNKMSGVDFIKKRPKVAIIDSNTLASIGLKQMLQAVVPVMQIDTFSSFDEMVDAGYDIYYHYFVATSVVLENLLFFTENRKKTIVLANSSDPKSQPNGFHSLCITDKEDVLVKSLLRLQHGGHPHGINISPSQTTVKTNILSNREIEVLSLIVKGKINKEIADILNIGMTTVITHRKNIMEKLGVRSVSALTIYAVMHGYVDINKI